MKWKSRRSFLRNAGLGGAVVLRIGVGSGTGRPNRRRGRLFADRRDGRLAHVSRGPVRSGYTSNPGPVAAPTARRLGQSDPSVDSNVAVADGVFYFVRNRARTSLTAFDLDRGDDGLGDGRHAGIGGRRDRRGRYGLRRWRVPARARVRPGPADTGGGRRGRRTVQWEYEFDPVTVTWPTAVDARTYVVADDSLVCH